MKFGKKSLRKLWLLLLVAVLLVVAAQVNGEEEQYDEDMYGPQDPIIFTKPLKAVAFYHKTHTKGAGLECDSCHDSLFQMAAGTAEENDDFTMKSLYEGKYCGACHDGSMAFAANTRCATCHIGVKGYNQLTGVSAGHEEGGH